MNLSFVKLMHRHTSCWLK